MPKKSELSEYRDRLLALQARIRGDVAQLTDEALDSGGSNGDSKSPTHLAELGTQSWEQDFSLRRVEDDQEVLEEITAALKRIDDGTYGTCAMCLEEGKTPAKATIIKSRLQLIPYARHCIECERKREEYTA
jgi:DnaK suppressor protein